VRSSRSRRSFNIHGAGSTAGKAHGPALLWPEPRTQYRSDDAVRSLEIPGHRPAGGRAFTPSSREARSSHRPHKPERTKPENIFGRQAAEDIKSTGKKGNRRPTDWCCRPLGRNAVKSTVNQRLPGCTPRKRERNGAATGPSRRP